MVQWLGLCVFTAKGPGLITKVPQAVWCSQKTPKIPQNKEANSEFRKTQSLLIMLIVSPCDPHSLSRIVNLFAVTLPPEHRTEP